MPSLTQWQLLGVGSPYADRCHIALRPGLGDSERETALGRLLRAIEAEAVRRNAVLVVYKDLASAELALMEPALTSAHYGRIRSLPVAALPVSATDVSAYIATLSSATRKDVRRKLKAAGAIRIERRTTIDDIAKPIEDLYEETRRHSIVHYGDFETLPPGYFRAVAESGIGAEFLLYWIDGELAAFNLLLIGRDVVIDKFLGMRYPLAQAHNIYVVSWIENVGFCLERGRRLLQTGQTAYRMKLRLGSQLQPSWIMVRHRNRLLNRLVRLAAPLAAFDRGDPDLRQLSKTRHTA